MAVDYDSKQYLDGVDTYWRAANYLSVGQLFLRDNPLLNRDLTSEDVKVKPLVTGEQSFLKTSFMRT